MLFPKAYTLTEEYHGYQFIHPLMQEQVRILIEYAKSRSDVEWVIVFGSSVSDRCTSYSDLDIVVNGKVRHFTPGFTRDIEVDILFYDEYIEHERGVWKEISRNGVTVFRR